MGFPSGDECRQSTPLFLPGAGRNRAKHQRYWGQAAKSWRTSALHRTRVFAKKWNCAQRPPLAGWFQTRQIQVFDLPGASGLPSSNVEKGWLQHRAFWHISKERFCS